MTNLSFAAKQLLDAQQHWDEVSAYSDNLPADPQYDLGFAMQLSWGGSTTGYKTVIYELHQRMKAKVRDEIATIKKEAWEKLLQAERDMKSVAKDHRRA